MKQKYTITVADIEMNVISDESAEAVEALVGIVDRKMREIGMMSKRVSKSEAALLCALDFCAEKIQAKERIDILESQLDDALTDVENLKENIEILKRNLDRLERENQRLQSMSSEAEEEKTEPEVKEEKPQEEKKNNSRNRVGSMFDLLTFSDI